MRVRRVKASASAASRLMVGMSFCGSKSSAIFMSSAVSAIMQSPVKKRPLPFGNFGISAPEKVASRIGFCPREVAKKFVAHQVAVGRETTFRSVSGSVRDDRDETQFHFQNDLPVIFNFQTLTSRIGIFREVSTVNLRVLSCGLSHTIFTFRGRSPRWQNLVHSGLPISPPARRSVSLPKCGWLMTWARPGPRLPPNMACRRRQPGHGAGET
jgi:hypothetical protein